MAAPHAPGLCPQVPGERHAELRALPVAHLWTWSFCRHKLTRRWDLPGRATDVRSGPHRWHLLSPEGAAAQDHPHSAPGRGLESSSSPASTMIRQTEGRGLSRAGGLQRLSQTGRELERCPSLCGQQGRHILLLDGGCRDFHTRGTSPKATTLDTCGISYCLFSQMCS